MDPHKNQKKDDQRNHEVIEGSYMRLLGKFNSFSNFMIYSIPPGPRFIPFNKLINIQKGSTWIIVLSMMIYFDNFSLGAWVYFALHGSYGICWILKDLIFPDKKFGENITLISASLPVSVMTIYLIPGKEHLSLFSLYNDIKQNRRQPINWKNSNWIYMISYRNFPNDLFRSSKVLHLS